MHGKEREEIRERREREYRQWNHDNLAKRTSELEKALLQALFYAAGPRDDIKSQEAGQAYRDGELIDYVREI